MSSLIIGGWDPVHGPSIYQIPPGGTCVKRKVALGGSGSTFIQAYVDKNYKEGFSFKEAREFMVQGIF